MTRKFWAIPALFLLAAGAPALAAEPAPAANEAPAQAREEARIPFADKGGIRDWSAGADDETLYVQDSQRRWYKATLLGPAFALNTEWAIGFDTGTGGTFDRFSHVVVDGQRYAVGSLVRIEGEPPRRGEQQD